MGFLCRYVLKKRWNQQIYKSTQSEQETACILAENGSSTEYLELGTFSQWKENTAV